MHTVAPQFVASPAHYFPAIDRQKVGYMLDTDPPSRPGRSVLRPDTEPSPTSMDYVRRIVVFFREHAIDLQIFITPSHAHQLEIAAETGVWPAIEQGKRDLVAGERCGTASVRPTVRALRFCDLSLGHHGICSAGRDAA